jgi:hypothetical protein
MNWNKLTLALAALTASTAISHAAFVTVGTATENRITADTRWTRDNVYILSRVIFVTNGANLTIEPGTIVRGVNAGVTGLSGLNSEPGCLVVARGSKLIANGTVEDPIIFTSIDDTNVAGGAATVPSTWRNVNGVTHTIKGTTRHASLQKNDYSPSGKPGDNGFSKAARWGGVVLCGRAYVSQSTPTVDANADGLPDGLVVVDPNDASLATKGQNRGTGADYVEGLATESGSTVLNSSLAIYGGTNDADNSGVMRFCSLRYGGFVIGVGNEINGLTICGCGTGSTFEHIEVFQNADDGFEWFGGKHNTRFLFSMSNHDDSFDGDEGYRGINQFWTAAQGSLDLTGAGLRTGFTIAAANTTIGQEVTNVTEYGYLNPLEWDGGESNNSDRLPKTEITIYNLTTISGNTTKKGFLPKLEAQMSLYNVVVENANAVSEIADATGSGIATTLRWNNLRSFTPNATGTAEIGVTTGVTQETPLVEETQSNTSITGPVHQGIYKKNGLDLRLRAGAPARTVGSALPPSGFAQVAFAGSMQDNNMLAGWSTVEKLQVLPVSNITRPEISIGLSGSNPTVSFTSAGAGVQYVIEKSGDQRNWTVVTTTSGTGTVTHTDTTTTLGSAPVYYRAYAL